MKKFLGRGFLVACLLMALIVSGFGFGDVRAESADDLTEKWVDVEFSKPMRIKWSWNDFMTSAVTAERNMNLSVAGLVMSQASEMSREKAEGVLGTLGFGDLKSEYYLLSTETKNDVSQPARTFGHKLVEKDGKQYHIICAIFKGTTTLDDAITDARAAVDGFSEAGENCEKSLDEYVKGISGATKENTILFITGHSLGAATANVVGLLCDDLVVDGSKFVYTYASPNYKVTAAGTTKDNYDNFIRFTNADDSVPLVPPVSDLLHYNHVGREVYYNLTGLDADTKAKFDKVYKYMRDQTYEADSLKIKDHMGDTYMSFILSESLTDSQIDEYLGSSSDMAPGTSASPAASAAPDQSAAPATDPAQTAAPQPAKLKANPIKVSGKTVKVKAGKKRTLKVGKVLKVKNAKGKVTYKKQSGNKKVTINKKTGKVTIKKGLKKGTYKIKVKVTAAGNSQYKKKTVKAVFRLKAS